MQIITPSHKNYPELFRNLHRPPKKLFAVGNVSLLNKTSIAIVGTRRCSDYGKRVTEKIIEDLSVLDVVIVSGMAQGIDTIAHKTALKYKMSTIAVLGSSLDHIYPKENAKLAEEIAQKGLLLSQFPPNTPPQRTQFPQRNELISALAIATIVTEAPLGSGALITADFALNQGREIFAVPGDVDRENSAGILKLLQEGGASPIKDGMDIVAALKAPQQLTFSLSPDESKIISELKKNRFTNFGVIQQKTAITTERLLSSISMLEINGLIENKGGLYRLKC